MALYDETNDLPKGLLLCNYKINQGGVTIESINAFLDYSKYPIFPYSLKTEFDPEFPFDDFDFIIIHYSIIPTLNGYINQSIKNRLKQFKGPIIQFVQDDYRRTDQMASFINEVNVSAIFSPVPIETAQFLYAKANNINHYTYLTGYASSWLNLEKTIPLNKRKTIVGYRGREYPYWFGETITIKVDLAKKLKKILTQKFIKNDISIREKDRVYGRDWVKFLQSCRAVYGTESDIDFIDPDGSVGEWYNTLQQLNKNKRKKWDGKTALTADFFKDHSVKAPKGMAVIPPRVMETICLRTASILVEGHYSGVIIPWRHYLPLKQDLSNLPEVIKFLKDDDKVSQMVATAYAEIATNKKYMWEGFGAIVDEALDLELAGIECIPLTSLNTIEQLEYISGKCPYIQNPHTATVQNPFHVGIKFVLLRKLRSVWRLLLARYRSLLR